ncbi:hypothetical protein [Glutamicibacter creatinolyticus]|uniref:hypothetical protein n=1 Tax=Glutamicibacter creatinolyticus TaxID=162496 RepID=UPI003217A2CC
MVKSRLLDKGAEWLLVYPEVTVVNRRGTHVRQPVKTPVRRRATVVADRSQTADVQGQIDVEIIKVIMRDAPIGPWSKVARERDGQEFDLTAPPHFTQGATRATRHAEFTLRARSKLGVPRG